MKCCLRVIHLTTLGVSMLLTPMLAMADPRQELIDAFSKVSEHDGFRIEVDARGAGGGTPPTRVDVQPPDRFHMRSAEGEFIVHPAGTWVRQAGQWMRMPMDMSGLMAEFSQPGREEAEEKIGEVELVGREDVRGCDSKVYRYRGVEDGRPQESTVAVCQRDGLPIRVQNQEGAEQVTLYFDFHTPIDIQPPR